MTNTFANYIDDFLKYKADVEDRSPRTCDGYKRDLLNKFLPFMVTRNKTSVNNIDQRDIEEFLIFIKQGSKSGSVANRNRKLATINSFFTFLKTNGVLTENKAAAIKASKIHTKTISYLNDDEKERLLTTVETTATPFYRLRDLAILKLFLGTGLRVSELTNLRLKDLEFHAKQTSYIRITRKGGNEARLPVSSKIVFAIRAYLAKREQIDSTPFVFLSRNHRQIDAHAVYHMVKRYLHAAGITKNKRGPHILRHTVGVSLRRKGVDIATIQHLFGHKKLETTAIYLNVESQDLEKAVQLL